MCRLERSGRRTQRAKTPARLVRLRPLDIPLPLADSRKRQQRASSSGTRYLLRVGDASRRQPPTPKAADAHTVVPAHDQPHRHASLQGDSTATDMPTDAEMTTTCAEAPRTNSAPRRTAEHSFQSFGLISFPALVPTFEDDLHTLTLRQERRRRTWSYHGLRVRLFSLGPA